MVVVLLFEMYDNTGLPNLYTALVADTGKTVWEICVQSLSVLKVDAESQSCAVTIFVIFKGSGVVPKLREWLENVYFVMATCCVNKPSQG